MEQPSGGREGYTRAGLHDQEHVHVSGYLLFFMYTLLCVVTDVHDELQYETKNVPEDQYTRKYMHYLQL